MPSTEQSEESEPKRVEVAKLTDEEQKLYAHLIELIHEDLEDESGSITSIDREMKTLHAVAVHWITKNHGLIWFDKDTCVGREYAIENGVIFKVGEDKVDNDFMIQNPEVYMKLWDISTTMRRIGRTRSE